MVVSFRKDSLCFTPHMPTERLAAAVATDDKVVVLWSASKDDSISYLCSNVTTADLNLMLDAVKQMLLQGELNA